LASAYAFRRPVANTYLVRERDRRLRRELFAVVGVVLSLGGGLLGYTWMHLALLDAGYRIVALEREARDLAQEERRLSLETAYLASPQRVESRAAKELGMQSPAIDQVVFWEEIPLASAATAAAPPIEPPAPSAPLPAALEGKGPAR